VLTPTPTPSAAPPAISSPTPTAPSMAPSPTTGVSTPVPKAPDINVESGDGEAVLTWEKSKDNDHIEGYYVLQDDKIIATLDANDTSYKVKNLENDVEYHFELVAFDTEGNKSQTREENKAVAKPTLTQPSDVVLEQEGGETVLTWEKANSPNVKGYHIYQDDKLIASVGYEQTRYVLIGYIPNKNSKFEVSSYDKNGRESKSVTPKSMNDTFDKSNDRSYIDPISIVLILLLVSFITIFWLIIVRKKRNKNKNDQ
jgi:hypothetical protein